MIWPYASVVWTGSSQIAAAPVARASRAAELRSSQDGTGGRRKAKYSIAGSATALAAVTSAAVAVHGATASTVKTMAAAGG